MLMLWIVLFVREALIYLVVALAPMAWATSVWPAIASVRRRVDRAARGAGVLASWRSRWRSPSVSARSGGLGATGNPGESTVDNGLAEFSTLVVGIITFGLAAFMPFLVIKLIPIVEAAVIAQGIHSAPMRAAQTGLQYSYYFNGRDRPPGRNGHGRRRRGTGSSDDRWPTCERPGDSRRRPGQVRSGAATVSTPPSRARTGSRRSCGPGCSDRCRPRRSSSSSSAAACRSSAILLRLFPWALLPALVAAVIAFKRVAWVAAARADPAEGRRGLRRRAARRWFRPVPLLAPASESADELPPAMHGSAAARRRRRVGGDTRAGWRVSASCTTRPPAC